MNIRTYLAGQALAGLCANTDMTKSAEECFASRAGFVAAEQFAKCAVTLADALLAELGKEKT